jgi:hypothetical protein
VWTKTHHWQIPPRITRRAHHPINLLLPIRTLLQPYRLHRRIRPHHDLFPPLGIRLRTDVLPRRVVREVRGEFDGDGDGDEGGGGEGGGEDEDGEAPRGEGRRDGVAHFGDGERDVRVGVEFASEGGDL